MWQFREVQLQIHQDGVVLLLKITTLIGNSQMFCTDSQMCFTDVFPCEAILFPNSPLGYLTMIPPDFQLLEHQWPETNTFFTISEVPGSYLTTNEISEELPVRLAPLAWF